MEGSKVKAVCRSSGKDGWRSDGRGWDIQTHWETRERRWKQRLVISSSRSEDKSSQLLRKARQGCVLYP